MLNLLWNIWEFQGSKFFVFSDVTLSYFKIDIIVKNIQNIQKQAPEVFL